MPSCKGGSGTLELFRMDVQGLQIETILPSDRFHKSSKPVSDIIAVDLTIDLKCHKCHLLGFGV